MTEYIITGATGFIGSKLVEELFQLGYKPLKVITRNKENAKRLLQYQVEIIEGDITNKEFLETVINNNSVIFHLAGIVEITSSNRKKVYDINYYGSKNLFDIALEKNIRKIIYSSSSSVIENSTKIIKEPTNFTINALPGHYAKSKALATDYFLKKTKEGLNGVVVYPTAVFGTSYGDSEINTVINKYISGKLPFYIKGNYNFVDVDDVVNGIIKAFKQGEVGEGYLLSGENLTLKQFFKTINDVTKNKKKSIKIPLFLVYLLMPFIRIYYFLSRKTPLFTLTSLKILNQNNNFDCSKATKSLDYTITNFNISLAKTIDFLNNKK